VAWDGCQRWGEGMASAGKTLGMDGCITGAEASVVAEGAKFTGTCPFDQVY